MADDVGKSLLEFLKLSPRWLAPLALATGALIFSPPHLLQVLGLDGFVGAYRGYIGAAFVLVACLLSVGIISATFTVVVALVSTPLVRRQRRASIRKRLKQLSEEEKQILRYYVARNTTTNWLKPQNGAVVALRSAGIIQLTSTTGNILEGFAMMLTNDAAEILYEDLTVLEGKTNVMYTDKRY